MSIKWNVPNMQRDLVSGEHKDIITRIDWIASKEVGTEENSKIVAMRAGSKWVTLVGEPKPYADVTEEDAIKWVKDAMGEEQVKRYEDEINAEIDEKTTPTKATGVSW